MTVSTELSHEEYTGNGVTTDFDFRFRIFEAKHLVVSIADTNGTERILTNGTDYTLRGVGSYRGGKVILKMPLATGWKIGIARDLPAVQETDLRNQGKFFAEVHEDAFDYLTMLVQKIFGFFSLCLRKPSFISDHYDAKSDKISNLGKPAKDSDAVDLGTMKEHVSAKDKRSLRVADKDIPALPGADMRRNKQLGFDNNGMPLLLDPAETGALGYVFVDSFEDGAVITSRYQALHWLHNGEYYRWDGDLPKSVPAGSTPESSGGVGTGAWVSVGDASLRTEISKGRFKYSDAESVYYVPGIVFDDTTDNRDVAFSYPGKIYIPDDVTIRVNLLPDDDVRKFVGEGKLIVKNQWYGNDIIFDIGRATNGGGVSLSDVLYQAIYDQEPVSIGIVGDSITDGAWGKQDWTSPPVTNGDLTAPISYNHSLADNGGSHSWCAHWAYLMNSVQSRYSATLMFHVYNASLSGAKLSDGWGYRNFDIGFFGNSAYGAKPPKACILAMGWNDISAGVEVYRDKIDMFVRKARGYGCAVAIVTVNDNDPKRIGFEHTTKLQMSEKLGVEYYNLGEWLTQAGSYNTRSQYLYYVKKEGVWDTTHPQELGHMNMGAAMFMQTLGKKYVRKVKAGDVQNAAVVESFWDAVTPSNKHLQPAYGVAQGTPVLNQMGFLPSVKTNGENITFTTMVWCEDDGVSLTIFEPWNKHSSTSVNNNVTVYSPAGISLSGSGEYADRNIIVNNYRTILRGKVASSYFGKDRTLSTYCGQLRKGLNLIRFIYDGNPDTAWYPILKFGDAGRDGVHIQPTRLSKAGNMAKPILIAGNGSQIDDGIVTNLMSGNQFSKTTDAYLSPGSIVGRLRVPAGLSKNTFIALNYDYLMDTGVLVGCADNGQIAIGTRVGGEPKDWLILGDNNHGQKGFTVWIYTDYASGDYLFTVKSDDGAVNSSSFKTSLATSGYVGVFNRTSSSAIFEFDMSLYPVSVGQ